MKISGVKVYCLKPFGLFNNCNSWAARKNTYNYIQVSTDEGVDGFAVSSLTGGNALSLESGIQNIRDIIIGMDPFDRERIYRALNYSTNMLRVNRFWNSAIDFALWDIAGKALGAPVYKLIGGYRDKMRAYASSLAYSSIEDYIRVGKECEAAGFTAYKLHGFNDPRKDIELCEAVREAFPKMDLMLDSLCSYDRKGALEVGRVVDRLGFYWYESPLREEDYAGHRLLRSKLDIQIAATELSAVGFLEYPKYIENEAVDIVRTFGDYMGGITPMLKTAHLCEANHIKLEPHSFGPTLVQAAHLHVMLAIYNCDFFESPVPEGEFDKGVKDVIRVQKDGCVYAPTKPGMGFDIDWDCIDNETERVL